MAILMERVMIQPEIMNMSNHRGQIHNPRDNNIFVKNDGWVYFGIPFYMMYYFKWLIQGSFLIYEQPKWERIVASTQVGFKVSIWVRIRVWIRVRLGLYFGCSYIEKGPDTSNFAYQ